MGISTSAVVFCGLERDAFPDENQLEAWVDAEQLSVCHRYYDAPWHHCLFGYFVEIGEAYCSPAELTWPPANLEALKAKFRDVTGLVPKVWLTPHQT